MSGQLPPHYDDTHSEQAPSYNSTSDISTRWHIINTPAKGIYGSRGISFVSDQPASTNSSSTTQLVDGLGYDLLFVDSAQLEVHPRAPPKERSGSSSGETWKTPLVAKIQLSTQSPTQATVTLTGEREAKVTVDARDLSPDPFQPQSTTTNTPTYITMYHMTPKADILPVCWSAEPNREYIEPPDSDLKNPSNDSDSNPIKTESSKKSSWKSKLKGGIYSKPPTAEEQQSKDNKLKQQKQALCSNFTLQDARGTIYARFSNELFKDISTFTKVPTYEKTAKQLKSWGHLDLNSSYHASLRSMYPMFEKWSDNDMQLVALCTLLAILEINVKINGGAGPTAAFSSYYSVTNGGDPRAEGMPAAVGAGLRAVGQSLWFSTG